MGIATVLLERGLISRSQLEEAIAEQRATGERLDRVLVRLGMVSAEQVLRVLGDQFHLPVVELPGLEVESEVLGLLPPKVVFKQQCVPISRENGTLTVATSDPFELAVADELRLLTGCAIRLVLADEEDLRNFIRGHYGVGGDTLDAMSAGAGAGADVSQEGAGGDEVEQAQEASVIRLVNDLLTEAVSERATDVHIEPYEGRLAVRYRIDGVLQRASVPPTIHRYGAAIVSRLKIMSSLNVSEKRRPQDGRITFRAKGQEFDLRVSVIPMLFGEGVVLRVLNKSAPLLGLDRLGMPGSVMERWESAIARPHGIVLVTGPTGSGKSTTLYASLNTITTDAVKVITVEDPVEYHVPGVNQIQVNHKVGLDFAAGLRSILRHDPDVVMIGEIRDRETAEVAVQASLTGHLVFSTLHTNDSASAVTRLLDMGVEPCLVSSSLEAALAQRLVRRVCEACARSYVPEARDVPRGMELAPGETLVRGDGCRACRQTGYRGRVGVYEILTMTARTRELVLSRSASHAITAAALEDGDLLTLREDGLAKARAGLTTVEEVVRALSA